MRYFWKRGNIKKSVHWNRRLSFLCTLCIRVCIPFTLYTYVLAKILYTKSGKIYTKTDSWFQKSHEKFGQLETSEKSKKVKCDRLLLSKNTFLQLKHYINKIYVTLLSTTCVRICQITCVIFEAMSHFSRRNCSVFFLAQILHTFYKSSTSKCKFSDFPLL